MANYTIAAIETTRIVAKLKKELGNWEEAEQRYKEMLNLANQALNNMEELSDEERQIAFAAADEAVYNIAFARYVEKDYATATSLLTSSELDLLKSEILLGLCFCQKSFQTREIKFSIEAAPHLLVLENCQGQLAKEEIDSMDDHLLAEGYFQLSLLYRFGFGVDKSLQKAYQTLESGLKNIEGERRATLEQEMSHYKKTLFGNWEYR